jgi:glutamine amidotransferase-like uncharacterized protein
MNIRVYNGSGSSNLGSPILIEAFQTFLPDADVAGIGEKEMRGSDAWKKDTSLLVFSATSVTQFKEALGEDVLKDIQHGVHDGAFDYAGICAGACFAAGPIKYRMKSVDSDKVIDLRGTGLGFFNGLATGPAKSICPLPFSGDSENLDLVALRDVRTGRRYNSFFWGGPALIPTAPLPYEQGHILSVLEKDSLPMSFSLKHGAGRVTICAHHPEITQSNLGRWAEKHAMGDKEWQRLSGLAEKLDGTAFTQFLTDARLAMPESAVHRDRVFAL